MRRKRDILGSSKKLRRKRLLKKLVLVFFFLLFVFSCATAFFYAPYLRVKKISLEGNSSLSAEKILGEVSNYLQGKFFRIFPRDNILLLSKEAIVTNLLRKFPRIEEVSLLKNFPDGISVKIKERQQKAILCANESPPARGCFFIDENGYVFEEAPYFSGDVYLKFFDERESPPGAPGFQIISEEQFKKLLEFRDFLSRENIKISKIILKKEGIYEADISEGWYILLNEQNEPKISYENLKISLDSKIQGNRQKLEYIDLRFGNKVFYKFK
jgi:cell division septal protein FtsQ